LYWFGTASKIQFWGQAARPARHPASRPARQAASQPYSQAASQPGHPDSQRGSQASQAASQGPGAAGAQKCKVYIEIKNCMGLGQPPKFSSGASQPGQPGSQPGTQPGRLFWGRPMRNPRLWPRQGRPKSRQRRQPAAKMVRTSQAKWPVTLKSIQKPHNSQTAPRGTFLGTSHAEPPVMAPPRQPPEPPQGAQQQ
jgi:hypothetical protein